MYLLGLRVNKCHVTIVHRKLLLNNLLPPLHFLIINSYKLQINSLNRHLVLLPINIEYLSLLPFVLPCEYLNKVIFDDIPAFEWNLDRSPRELPAHSLLQHFKWTK